MVKTTVERNMNDLFNPTVVGIDKYLANIKTHVARDDNEEFIDANKIEKLGLKIYNVDSAVTDAFAPPFFYDSISDIKKRKQNQIGKSIGLDDVNLNEWWDACFRHFPVLTVGHNLTTQTLQQQGLKSCISRGFITAITSFAAYTINRSGERPHVLEIGPGYGQSYKWLKAAQLDDFVSYYALDVSKQFECDTLFIGDGKKFPSDISKLQFEYIFSSNCFQHLSVKQKTRYFKDIKRCLAPGGIFQFDVFAIPDHLGDYKQFNPKCLFFGQLVPIQKYSTLKRMIESAGLTIVQEGHESYPAQHIYCVNFTIENKTI